MSKDAADDLFAIQIRLFRLFQLKEKLSPEQAEDVFRKYDIFNYISVCYEIYHVQGDDANLADIYIYLSNMGWKK